MKNCIAPIITIHNKGKSQVQKNDYIAVIGNTLIIPSTFTYKQIQDTSFFDTIKNMEIKFIRFGNQSTKYYQLKNPMKVKDIMEKYEDEYKKNFKFQYGRFSFIEDVLTNIDNFFNGIFQYSKGREDRVDKAYQELIKSQKDYYSTIKIKKEKVSETLISPKRDGEDTMEISVNTQALYKPKTNKQIFDFICNMNETLYTGDGTIKKISIKDSSKTEIYQFEIPNTIPDEKKSEYLKFVFRDIDYTAIKNSEELQQAIENKKNEYRTYTALEDSINDIITYIGLTSSDVGYSLKHILYEILKETDVAGRDAMSDNIKIWLKKIYDRAGNEKEDKVNAEAQIEKNLGSREYKDEFIKYIKGNYNATDNIECTFLTTNTEKFSTNLQEFVVDSSVVDATTFEKINHIFIKKDLTLNTKTNSEPFKVSYEEGGIKKEYYVFIKLKQNNSAKYLNLKTTNVKNFDDIVKFLSKDQYDIVLIPNDKLAIDSGIITPSVQSVNNEDCFVLRSGKCDTIYITKADNIDDCPPLIDIYDRQLDLTAVSGFLNGRTSNIEDTAIVIDPTTNTAQVKINGRNFYLYKQNDEKNIMVGIQDLTELEGLEDLKNFVLVPSELNDRDNVFSPEAYFQITECGKRETSDKSWKNIKLQINTYKNMQFSALPQQIELTIQKGLEDDQVCGQCIQLGDAATPTTFKIYSVDSPGEYHRVQDASDMATSAAKYILSSGKGEETVYYQIKKISSLTVGDTITLNEMDKSQVERMKIYDTPSTDRHIKTITINNVVLLDSKKKDKDTINIKIDGAVYPLYQHDGYGNLSPIQVTSKNPMSYLKNGEYIIYDKPKETWLKLSHSKTGLTLINPKNPIFKIQKPKTTVTNIPNLFDYVKVVEDSGKYSLHIDWDGVVNKGINVNLLTKYIENVSNELNFSNIKIKCGKNTYNFDENSLFITDKHTIVNDTIQFINSLGNTGYDLLEQTIKSCQVSSSGVLTIDFSTLIPSGLDEAVTKKIMRNILQCINNSVTLDSVQEIKVVGFEGRERSLKPNTSFQSNKIKIAYLMYDIDELFDFYSGKVDKLSDMGYHMQCYKTSDQVISYLNGSGEQIYVSQDIFNSATDLREEISKKYDNLYVPFETILSRNKNITYDKISKIIQEIDKLELSPQVKKILIKNIDKFSLKSLMDISANFDIFSKGTSLPNIKSDPELYLNFLQIYDFYLIQNPKIDVKDFFTDSRIKNIKNAGDIEKNKKDFLESIQNIIQQDILEIIPAALQSELESRVKTQVQNMCERCDIDEITTVYNLLGKYKNIWKELVYQNATSSTTGDKIKINGFLDFLDHGCTQLSSEMRKKLEEAVSVSQSTYFTNNASLDIMNFCGTFVKYKLTDGLSVEEMLELQLDNIIDKYKEEIREENEKRKKDVEEKFNEIYGEGQGATLATRDFQEALRKPYFQNLFGGEYEQISKSLQTDAVSAIVQNDILYKIINEFSVASYVNMKGERQINVPLYLNIFSDILYLSDLSDSKGNQDNIISECHSRIMGYINDRNVGLGGYNMLCQLLERDDKCLIQSALSFDEEMDYIKQLQPDLNTKRINFNPMQIYIGNKVLQLKVAEYNTFITSGTPTEEERDSKKVAKIQEAVKISQKFYKVFEEIEFAEEEIDVKSGNSEKMKEQIFQVVKNLMLSGVKVEDIRETLKEMVKTNSNPTLRDIDIYLHSMAFNLMEFGNIKGTTEGVCVSFDSSQIKKAANLLNLCKKINDKLSSISDKIKKKQPFILENELYKNIIPDVRMALNPDDAGYRQAVLDIVKLTIKNDTIFDETKQLLKDKYDCKDTDINDIIQTIKLYLSSTVTQSIINSKQTTAKDMKKYTTLVIKTIVSKIGNTYLEQKSLGSPVDIKNYYNILKYTLQGIISHNNTDVTRDARQPDLSTQRVFSDSYIIDSNTKLSRFVPIQVLGQLSLNTGTTEKDILIKDASKKMLANTALLQGIVKDPGILYKDIEYCLDLLVYIKQAEGKNSILFDKLDNFSVNNIKNMSNLFRMIKHFQNELFTYQDQYSTKFFDKTLFNQFLQIVEGEMNDLINDKGHSVDEAISLVLNDSNKFADIVSKAILNKYAVQYVTLPVNEQSDFIKNRLPINSLILDDMKKMVSAERDIGHIFIPFNKGKIKTFDELSANFNNKDLLHINQYSYQTLYRYGITGGEEIFNSMITGFNNDVQQQRITRVLEDICNNVQQFINTLEYPTDFVNIVASMFGIFSENDKDGDVNTANKNFWNNIFTNIVEKCPDDRLAELTGKLISIVEKTIAAAGGDEDLSIKYINKIADILKDSLNNIDMEDIYNRYDSLLGQLDGDLWEEDGNTIYNFIYNYIATEECDTSFLKYASSFEECKALKQNLSLDKLVIDSQTQFDELYYIMHYMNNVGTLKASIVKADGKKDAATLIKENKLSIANYICQQLIENFDDLEEKKKDFLIAKIASYDGIYYIQDTPEGEQYIADLIAQNGNAKYGFDHLDLLSQNIMNTMQAVGLNAIIQLEYQEDENHFDVAMAPYLRNTDNIKIVCNKILGFSNHIEIDPHDDVPQQYILLNDNQAINEEDIISTIETICDIQYNKLFKEYNAGNAAHERIFADIIALIHDLKQPGKEAELEEYKKYIKNIFSNLKLDNVAIIRDNLVKRQHGDGVDLDNINLTIDNRKEFIKQLNDYASNFGPESQVENYIGTINELSDNTSDVLNMINRLPYMAKLMNNSILYYLITEPDAFENNEDRKKHILLCGDMANVVYNRNSESYLSKLYEIEENMREYYRNKCRLNEQIVAELDPDRINELEAQMQNIKNQEKNCFQNFYNSMLEYARDSVINCLIDDRTKLMPQQLQTEIQENIKNRSDQEFIVKSMIASQSKEGKIKLSEFINYVDNLIYNKSMNTEDIYTTICGITNIAETETLFNSEDEYSSHISRHIIMINFDKDIIGDIDGEKFAHMQQFFSYDLKQGKKYGNKVENKLTESEKKFLNFVMFNLGPDELSDKQKEIIKNIRDVGLYCNCLDDINSFLETQRLNGEAAISVLESLPENFALLSNQTYKDFIFKNYSIDESGICNINIQHNIELLKNLIELGCQDQLISELIAIDRANVLLCENKTEFIKYFYEERAEKTLYSDTFSQEIKENLLLNANSYSDFQKGIIKATLRNYFESVNIIDGDGAVIGKLSDNEALSNLIIQAIDRIKDEEKIKNFCEHISAIGNFIDDNQQTIIRDKNEFLHFLEEKLQNDNIPLLVTMEEYATLHDVLEAERGHVNEVLLQNQFLSAGVLPDFYQGLVNNGLYNCLKQDVYPLGICNEAQEILKVISPDIEKYQKMIIGGAWGWNNADLNGDLGLYTVYVNLISKINNLPDSDLKSQSCQKIQEILQACMNKVNEDVVANGDKYGFIKDTIENIEKLVDKSDNGMKAILDYSDLIMQNIDSYQDNASYREHFEFIANEASEMHIKKEYLGSKLFEKTDVDIFEHIDNIQVIHNLLEKKEQFQRANLPLSSFYSICSNMMYIDTELNSDLVLFMMYQNGLSRGIVPAIEEDDDNTKQQKEKIKLSTIKYFQDCIKSIYDNTEITADIKTNSRDELFRVFSAAVNDHANDGKIYNIIQSIQNKIKEIYLDNDLDIANIPSFTKGIEYNDLFALVGGEEGPDRTNAISSIYTNDFINKMQPNNDQLGIYKNIVQSLFINKLDFFDYKDGLYTINNEVKRNAFLKALENQEGDINNGRLGHFDFSLLGVLDNIDYNDQTSVDEFMKLMDHCGGNFDKKLMALEILSAYQGHINEILTPKNNILGNIYNFIDGQLGNEYDIGDYILLSKILPSNMSAELQNHLLQDNTVEFIKHVVQSPLNNIIEKSGMSIDSEAANLEDFSELLIRKTLENMFREHPIKSVAHEGENLPYSIMVDLMSDTIINTKFKNKTVENKIQYCTHIIDLYQNNVGVNLDYNYMEFLQNICNFTAEELAKVQDIQIENYIPSLERLQNYQLRESEALFPGQTAGFSELVRDNDINKYLFQSNEDGSFSLNTIYLELFLNAIPVINGDIDQLEEAERNQFNEEINSIKTLIRNIEEREEVINKDKIILNISKTLQSISSDQTTIDGVLNKINGLNPANFDTYFVENSYDIGSYILNHIAEDNINFVDYEQKNKIFSKIMNKDLISDNTYALENLMEVLGDNSVKFNTQKLQDQRNFNDWTREIIYEYIHSKMSNVRYPDGRPYCYNGFLTSRDELLLMSLAENIYDNLIKEQNSLIIKEAGDIISRCNDTVPMFDTLKERFSNEETTLDLYTTKYDDYLQIFGERFAESFYASSIDLDDNCDKNLLNRILIRNFDECINKDTKQILDEYQMLLLATVPSSQKIEEMAHQNRVSTEVVRTNSEEFITNIIQSISSSGDKTKTINNLNSYLKIFTTNSDKLEFTEDIKLSIFGELSLLNDKDVFEKIFSDDTNFNIFQQVPQEKEFLILAIQNELTDEFKKTIFFNEDKNISKRISILDTIKGYYNQYGDDLSVIPTLQEEIKRVNNFDELKNEIINILPQLFDSCIAIPDSDNKDRYISFSSASNAEEIDKIKEKIEQQIKTPDDIMSFIEFISDVDAFTTEQNDLMSYSEFCKEFQNSMNKPILDIGYTGNIKMMNGREYAEFADALVNDYYQSIIINQGKNLYDEDAMNIFLFGDLISRIYQTQSDSNTLWHTDTFGKFLTQIVPNEDEQYNSGKWQSNDINNIVTVVGKIFDKPNAEKIIEILTKQFSEDNKQRQEKEQKEGKEKGKGREDYPELNPVVSIQNIDDNLINLMDKYVDQLNNDNVLEPIKETIKIQTLINYNVNDDLIKSFYPTDKSKFETEQKQLNQMLYLIQRINEPELQPNFTTLEINKYDDAKKIINDINDVIFNNICDKLLFQDGTKKISEDNDCTKVIKKGLTNLINRAIDQDAKSDNPTATKGIYDQLINYVNSTDTINFNAFEANMLQIANDKLKNENKSIFELTYSQGIALRGEDEGKKVVAKKLAQDLYSGSIDPDKEVQQGKAEDIIKILFEDVTEGNIDNKKIKDMFVSYIKAIIPVNNEYTIEEQNSIQDLTGKIKDLETNIECNNIMNGIATTLSSYNDHDNKVNFIKDLNEIIADKGTEICTIFANNNNVDIIQKYTEYGFTNLEDTCVACEMMDKYVSDKLRDEITKNDSTSIENRKKIINVCLNIENNKTEYGIYLDQKIIKACETVDDFEKHVKDAKINYFIEQVTDKDGNNIESTHDGYNELINELNTYKEEDLDKLLEKTKELKMEIPPVTDISSVLSASKFYSKISYDTASKLFSEEYIEESLVVHISENILKDLGKTGDEKVQNNLRNILTSGKEKLLDKEKGQINDDYKDLIKIISNQNVEIDNDCSKNLATLIKKVDDLSNKEDVIKSITEILKNEDDKLPKLVKKLSDIEGEDIESMISKSPEIFTKLIKEDEVTAEQVKSTIEVANKLGIKDKIKGDIDVGDIQQIQNISKAVDIIGEDKIKINLATVKNTEECIKAYQEAIFDTMAAYMICKRDDESKTIFDLKSENNTQYQDICTKFVENIINNEDKLNQIKTDTKTFTKKVPFKDLLKNIQAYGIIGVKIIKDVTDEDVSFEEILGECSGLQWQSKGQEAQDSIIKLCQNDKMKKLVNYDEVEFHDDTSRNVFVNLVQNIPATKEEAKTYTQNVETIVDKIDEGLLRSVYGETDSKPLTIEYVKDLSRNTESINKLYGEDKVLTKHLMKKQEKTLDEIKQTATDIHSVIEPANTILMQSICDENQLDEIVKISKLGETNGLENLNQQIKEKFSTAETLEAETKKEIVEVIIDAQLKKLKTEDKEFLQDRDQDTVIETFKQRILTQPQNVYEEIVKSSEEEFDNTFVGFYRRFCGGGSVVITSNDLQDFVLDKKDKENSLIMENLDKLIVCVNDDFSVKENSLLSLLQNFTKDNINTLRDLEYDAKTKKNKKSEKKNAFEQLKAAVEEMANNPNALTEEYIRRLKGLPTKLQEYATSPKKNNLIKDISNDIEFLANKENSYYSVKECEQIDNSEEFERSLTKGEKLEDTNLKNAIHIISEQTFNSWKSLENKKTREEVFRTLVNTVDILNELNNAKSSQLLYNFVDQKKGELKITDISDIKLNSGEAPDQVYAKTLYSVIKKCDNQDEIKDIIGGNKITKTEFQKLAKVVAADKKPSKLVLDFLTKPDAEIIELEDNDRTDIINTLTDNKNSIIDDFNKYLLLNKLRHDNDYEFMHNDIKTKIETLSSSNPSIATGEIIFTLSDKAAVYDSIIENSKNGIISDDENKCYAAKISSLYESREEIIEIYHEFLDNSYKLCIGDNTKSKDAVVDVIIAACQEEPKLFTEIMTGDTFDEQNKIDFISGKYSPKKINTDIGTATANIIKECIEISTSTNNITDKINNEDIFIAGVNKALKHQEPTKILTICNEINNNIDVTNNSIASIESKGHLLGEIFAHQIISSNNLLDVEPFDKKKTAKEKKRIIKELDQTNKNIIEKLVSIDNEIYTKETEAEKEHVPSIYKFIESIEDSHKKEEQSKKIANEIISKKIEPAIVVNILSGCKNSDKEEEKSTYNAIISGLASRVTDSNSDYIQNIIKNCLAAEKDDEIKDIAVDLYYQISQRQNNTFEKGHLSSTSIKKLLIDTPLQDRIKDEKSDVYEIMNGGILAKKQERGVSDILNSLKLSPEQIRIYSQQIALLSTPEEIYTLLNDLIKNHNTNVDSDLSTSHIDLLTSTDKKKINAEFKEHDLQAIFTGDSAKEQDSLRDKFYDELQERADELPKNHWYRTGKTRRDAKHRSEIKSVIRNLKEKDIEFRKARDTLNNFTELHIKRAQEAADYIAKYNYYKKIMANEEGKYSQEYIDEAKRQFRKMYNKSDYDFMHHGAAKFGGFFRSPWNPLNWFCKRSNRKLYYAQWELKKSNKALRVVAGFEILPQMNDGGDLNYTMNTDFKLKPEDMTIKSKKLRWIEQRQNAGYWAQWHPKYRSIHETEVTRTEDSSVMKKITEEFIEDTSDLRKKGVELLTKKSYHSKSSLGKVEALGNIDVKKAQDVAFNGNKKKEKEKGGASVS